MWEDYTWKNLCDRDVPLIQLSSQMKYVRRNTSFTIRGLIKWYQD